MYTRHQVQPESTRTTVYRYLQLPQLHFFHGSAYRIHHVTSNEMDVITTPSVQKYLSEEWMYLDAIQLQIHPFSSIFSTSISGRREYNIILETLICNIVAMIFDFRTMLSARQHVIYYYQDQAVLHLYLIRNGICPVGHSHYKRRTFNG